MTQKRSRKFSQKHIVKRGRNQGKTAKDGVGMKKGKDGSDQWGGHLPAKKKTNVGRREPEILL